MSSHATLEAAPESLWRNHDFMRLWVANFISNAGTHITRLAIPLTAALTLGATPMQMGLLAMAGSLPNLLFGLVAGVWVDRVRRQPLMIAADIGRALLLASIPLAALMGSLTFIHLWVVAFVGGTLSIFFTIASVAVLPSIVKSEQLVDANSKFALSDSVLSIAGPSGTGGIISLLGAPKAILVDSCSYLVSAFSLRRVKVAETIAQPRVKRSTMWTEIWEGIQALIQTPLLLALTVSGAIGTVGFSIQGAVGILFLTRELGLGPALVGLVAACGGSGALLGAVVAGRTGRYTGVGMAVILGNLLWVFGGLITPFAGFGGITLPYLVVGGIVASLGATVFSVNQMSLRQRLTPVSLLGRVTAARRFLLFSLAPAGSAIGGLLGAGLGLRMTLIIGGLVGMVSVLIVLFSPVRAVQDLAGVTNSE